MARRSKPEPLQEIRCAIYTRKSNSEGLDGDFSSLDAQREAGEAYVTTQKEKGWVALPDRYDDGGFSGGNTDRPGFQRLLQDIEAGRIECVITYKYDRLSRSILDFLNLMEILDLHGVSFVSVTQQFDTTTSTGRLMLNMLLSFAQFEREIAADRIRDKVASSKRKGMHCGGTPILGYNTIEKRLVVNPEEGDLVRHIFERFCQIRSTTTLTKELNAQGHRTKSWTTAKGKVREGGPWNKAHVYRLLNNRKYIGQVTHMDKVYPGEHEAIVPRELWDEAHRILTENHKSRTNRTRSKTPALLKGIIRCGHCGGAMGITFTRRRGKMYRYYLCVHASKNGYDACPVRSVAAGEIEQAVMDQLRHVFRTPELIAKTYREAKEREAQEVDRLRHEHEELEGRLRGFNSRMERLLAADSGDNGSLADELRRTGTEIDEVKERLHGTGAALRDLKARSVTESEVRGALGQLDPVWEELFPAEQARIVQLLVNQVTVREDGLEVRLRCDGLGSLVEELADDEEAAA
jgi:site-specific DNA recombinase